MLQLKVRMPAKTESGRIGGNGGGRWTVTPAALCYGFLAPSHYLAQQLVALLGTLRENRATLAQNSL